MPSTGLRPKLSVSLFRCRISRLKLLEYQYYSTLDKMAALEPLTLQHLTVSTSASFPYHLHLSQSHTTLHLSHSHTTMHLYGLSLIRGHCHKYLAYIPVIVIPPPSPYTHSTHSSPIPITKVFVTKLKKQLFVESLVQGNMTVQVRLSACDVGGGERRRRRRRRGREGREREGEHSFICSYFLPLQEAKGLMTYICR